MRFSLDIRRARKGDCLLLHGGTKAAPFLVMIDGGPDNVYTPHLRPRLAAIKAARKLDDQKPLPIDLLIVSHVDDDHIRGILDFTRELIEAAGVPFARVSSLWHNTFDDVIGNTPSELTAALSHQFGTASLDGGLPDEATLDTDEDEEVIGSTLKVLASIEQGHRLRDHAKRLQVDLNPEFDGALIMADQGSVDMGDGLTFLVAGPMKPELTKLQQKHDAWLKEQKEKKKTSDQALSAYVDKSVPNLSSLVLLASSGGKRILLTGDARGDKILEGLEAVGALESGQSMHVDVLKVPHHGSSNNVERDFYERVTADRYVFSGNGEHGNPDRESLEMLVDARGADAFEIHLTYPIAEIDQARKLDHQKEQKKEKARAAKNGGKTTPRADWNPKTDSLEALIASGRLQPQQKIVIADPVRHVIDLRDEIDF
jgi:hypothetical protein